MASVFSSFRSMVLRARIPSRTIANPLVSRNLRSSAVLRASEAKGGGEGYDGPGQGYDGPSIPLYDRLSSSPPALAAIEHLVKLIKSKSGVDLQGGDAPSMNLMGQLANDPELRSAAQNLMTTLTNAGIDVDPRQAFAALKTMGGKDFDKVGDLDDYKSGGFKERDDDTSNYNSGGFKERDDDTSNYNSGGFKERDDDTKAKK